MFSCWLPLYAITIGTLLESYVLSTSTASFAAGSDVVVVATEVVEVVVGVTSSHSNDSHGHPVGQFSLIIVLRPPLSFLVEIFYPTKIFTR